MGDKEIQGSFGRWVAERRETVVRLRAAGLTAMADTIEAELSQETAFKLHHARMQYIEPAPRSQSGYVVCNDVANCEKARQFTNFNHFVALDEFTVPQLFLSLDDALAAIVQAKELGIFDAMFGAAGTFEKEIRPHSWRVMGGIKLHDDRMHFFEICRQSASANGQSPQTMLGNDWTSIDWIISYPSVYSAKYGPLDDPAKPTYSLTNSWIRKGVQS